MNVWTYLSILGLLFDSSASAGQTAPQETARKGYVTCVDKKNPSPVQIYEHPCKGPVGEIKCGETVEAVGRKGPYLKIKTADGSERFIGVLSVSQSNKKFIALDLPYEPWPNLDDCSAIVERQGGTHPPIVTYNPSPQYSEKARKAKISGYVQLSLTVGVDGLPHKILVTKSLGYGLDEAAIAAVQRWKFNPATEDGNPVPAPIEIEVEFSQ